MQFDADAAERLLAEANTRFAGMLPNPAAPMPAAGGQNSTVAEHARAYVAAIEGLQQQLVRFAAPPPTSTTAALEEEAAALQQELTRADSLLQETNAFVQQWQLRCQDLRQKHEAVLTRGVGPQQAVAMQADQQQQQQQQQDTVMEAVEQPQATG